MKNFFKIGMLLLLLTLAAIGTYTLLNRPEIQDVLNKLWAGIDQNKFKSSIARTQILKGFNPDGGKTRTKLRPKTPGRWKVGKTIDPDTDSTNLDDVLFSAGPLDNIALDPGTYTIFNLDLSVPLLIIGESAESTIIEVRSKSTLRVNDTRFKKIEIRGVTVRNLDDRYGGAFLDIVNSDLVLQDVLLLSSNSEIVLELKGDSSLDMDGSFLNAGNRSTAVHLNDQSQLIASNSQFIGNKIGIHGDINTFQGAVDVSNTIFKKSRSAGILLYNGTLVVENSTFEANLLGIGLFRKNKAEIRKSSFEKHEKNAVTLSDGASAKMVGVQINECGDSAIELSRNGTSLMTQDIILKKNKRGLTLYDQASLKAKNLSVQESRELGLILTKQATLECRNCLIENNGDIGLKLDASDVSLHFTTIKGQGVGVHTKNQSKILLENSFIEENRQALVNEYENSTITRK